MWHGVVGADDNSFLVVVTSRQKFPYNKFHFLNRMKIATSPSVQNDEECTFQQKKRVKSRTWCGRLPSCLMWKIQKNVPGENVDEVENWLEVQAGE